MNPDASAVLDAGTLATMSKTELGSMATHMWQEMEKLKNQPDSVTTTANSGGGTHMYSPNGDYDYHGDFNKWPVPTGPYVSPVPFTPTPSIPYTPITTRSEPHPVDVLKELLREHEVKAKDMDVSDLLAELEKRIKKMPTDTNEQSQMQVIAQQSLEMIRAFLLGK